MLFLFSAASDLEPGVLYDVAVFAKTHNFATAHDGNFTWVTYRMGTAQTEPTQAPTQASTQATRNTLAFC